MCGRLCARERQGDVRSLVHLRRDGAKPRRAVGCRVLSSGEAFCERITPDADLKITVVASGNNMSVEVLRSVLE